MENNFDLYTGEKRNIQHDLIMVGIIILTCIGSFFCGCEFNKNAINNTTNFDTLSHTKTIVLKYDSAIKYVARFYPVISIDSFNIANDLVVDTTAIINQYFTAYVLHDSLRTNDLFLSITDTLERNKIVGRFIAYKILRADSVITINTVVERSQNEGEKSHLFMGAIAGTYTLAPAIIYNRKNNYLIGLSSNLFLPQPSIQASIYFKIK